MSTEVVFFTLFCMSVCVCVHACVCVRACVCVCVFYLGLLLYFAAAGGEENTEGFNPKLGDTGGWRLIGELLNTLIHQLSYALLTDRGRFQHILVEQLSNQSDSPYRPLVDLVLCLLLHLERLPLLEVKGY